LHHHPTSSSRAVVFGGGGSAGNAWLIGLAAGLTRGGVELGDADLWVGTSAGATAAAQLAYRPAAELYEEILAQPPIPTRPGPTLDHLERVRGLSAASTDAADMRRRMGAAALALAENADGTAIGRWRATVAARLPSTDWPERRLLITAVDAQSGDPVMLERDSGLDLVDAVAASTSGGGAYRAGGRDLIDGGYLRNENADLAIGFDKVLVFSPLGGRTLHPLEWRMQLSAQVEDLEASGSSVQVVLPDEASLEAMGDNMMDLSRRPAVARAAFAERESLAPQAAAFWNGR